MGIAIRSIGTVLVYGSGVMAGWQAGAGTTVVLLTAGMMILAVVGGFLSQVRVRS